MSLGIIRDSFWGSQWAKSFMSPGNIVLNIVGTPGSKEGLGTGHQAGIFSKKMGCYVFFFF